MSSLPFCSVLSGLLCPASVSFSGSSFVLRFSRRLRRPSLSGLRFSRRASLCCCGNWDAGEQRTVTAASFSGWSPTSVPPPPGVRTLSRYVFHTIRPLIHYCGPAFSGFVSHEPTAFATVALSQLSLFSHVFPVTNQHLFVWL